MIECLFQIMYNEVEAQVTDVALVLFFIHKSGDYTT
nr:MAG TPA: hypothetical protein [Caudoviricetes sp.]